MTGTMRVEQRLTELETGQREGLACVEARAEYAAIQTCKRIDTSAPGCGPAAARQALLLACGGILDANGEAYLRGYDAGIRFYQQAFA